MSVTCSDDRSGETATSDGRLFPSAIVIVLPSTSGAASDGLSDVVSGVVLGGAGDCVLASASIGTELTGEEAGAATAPAIL